jgi:hypothetical protein
MKKPPVKTQAAIAQAAELVVDEVEDFVGAGPLDPVGRSGRGR